MDRVTFRLPHEDLEAVDELAETSDFVNRSDVLRAGVDRVLRDYDGDRPMTDGGLNQVRTLADAAEPALVGTCEACDGRLIEHIATLHDGTGSIQLECEDCDAEVRIEYEIGEEHPWETATEVDGIADATVKDVAWVDCDRCDGHGQIKDPFCDLRRVMNGRELTCPSCHGTGSTPRVVETGGDAR